MTKTLSELAAGLCALSLSFGAYAASDAYKAAKKQADTDYKMTKAECKKLTGAENKDCMKKATANYKTAEGKAKALKQSMQSAGTATMPCQRRFFGAAVCFGLSYPRRRCADEQAATDIDDQDAVVIAVPDDHDEQTPVGTAAGRGSPPASQEDQQTAQEQQSRPPTGINRKAARLQPVRADPRHALFQP